MWEDQRDDLLYSVKATKEGYFVAGNTISETMGFSRESCSEEIDIPQLQSTRHEPATSSVTDQVDGFVAFIDRNTLNISRGTYLGTDKFDATFLLDLDPAGNVHVIGQTQGNYEDTSACSC